MADRAAGRGANAGAGSGGVRLVIGELRQILARVTGDDELLGLAADMPLFGTGVGLDSLTGTLLLREVRRQFGVDVAAEDLNLDSLATLGALAAFIGARR